MITVPVELGARRYDVVVGAGARHLLGEVLPDGVGQVAVVSQEGIDVDVDAGVPAHRFTVGDGEGAKTLASVETLCRGFARAGLSRHDAVVAVGGGVVTDLAGFAAATYHRGLPYINVATTLLAQVDAAVGGKTGVNLPEGKNHVGAFWQPTAVLCDTETLETLPRREWASGRGGDGQVRLSDQGLGRDPALGGRCPTPTPSPASPCWVFPSRSRWRGASPSKRRWSRPMNARAGCGPSSITGTHWATPSRRRPSTRSAPGICATARRWPSGSSSRRAWPDAWVGWTTTGSRPTGGWWPDSTSPRGAAHPERPRRSSSTSWPTTKRAHRDLTFVLDGPRGVETVPGVDPDEVVATLQGMGASGGSG